MLNAKPAFINVNTAGAGIMSKVGANLGGRALFSSSSKRDFYDVLSMVKSADKGEIKKAYFKLAKKYHPDTNRVRRSTLVSLNISEQILSYSCIS